MFYIYYNMGVKGLNRSTTEKSDHADKTMWCHCEPRGSARQSPTGMGQGMVGS